MCDIRHNAPDERFDLILANPPYSSFLPAADTREGLNITLHAGVFGNSVSAPILDRVDELLVDGGAFFMIGTHLLKDGEIWHPAAERLKQTGSLLFLHQPISSALSWEGIRLLWAVTPDYDKIEQGGIARMIHENNGFNQVAWGILAYFKGAAAGYHRVYNLATDAVLVDRPRIDEIRRLIGDAGNPRPRSSGA